MTKEEVLTLLDKYAINYQRIKDLEDDRFKYKVRKLVKVVDGDTIDVELDLGFYIYHQIRLRLAYIDTHEIHGVKKESKEYQLGMLAKAYVEKVLSEAKAIYVHTLKDKTGKYGRFLALVFYVTADDKVKLLNLELLKNQLAEAY